MLRPPYASERVIYRTHSEILTDRKIITEGGLFHLKDIQAVGVVRTSYYLLVQGGRLLVLVVGLFFLAGALGWAGGSGLPGGTWLRLLIAGGLGALAYFVPWVVPTHSIRLTTPSGHTRIMYAGDADYLRMVVARIQDAIYQIPDTESKSS